MAEPGTEDDDLARLKAWWQSNGMSLVLGAVVGLAVIVGWQGWRMYSESQAEAASAAYAELQQAIASGQAGSDKIAGLADNLQSDYGGTPYAAQAGLAAAAYFVESQDYAGAGQQLQWVIDHADQPAMRHLARVRQARLLWAQDKPEAALALLDSSYPQAFTPLYAELAGDLHAAAGADAKARESYRAALEHLPPDTDPAPLKRKLADVSGGDQEEVS